VVHAATYYRRSQERERRALELEARLLMPSFRRWRTHSTAFSFNTLNAISTLVTKTLTPR